MPLPHMPHIDGLGLGHTAAFDMCRKNSNPSGKVKQVSLNRLASTAYYQAFIDQITYPTCRHLGREEEIAERLLPLWKQNVILMNPQTLQTCFKTSHICWTSSSLQGICLPI